MLRIKQNNNKTFENNSAEVETMPKIKKRKIDYYYTIIA